MPEPTTFITKNGGTQEKFETGAQRDSSAGKLRYDLISPIMLRRLAGLMTRGADHYGERNWEKGMPMSRYVESLLRHVYGWIEGEDTEEDHLAAMIFNIQGLMHVEELASKGRMPEEFLDAGPYNPKEEKS